MVNFARPRDAADIAALTRCRVIRPQSLVWLEGYQALIRWRAENEIAGLYAVPYDTETIVGTTKDYPWAGGSTSSAAPTAQANSTPTAPRC